MDNVCLLDVLIGKSNVTVGQAMRENGLYLPEGVSYDMLVKEYGAVVGCDHKHLRKGNWAPVKHGIRNNGIMELLIKI
jgi:hypothetical protein